MDLKKFLNNLSSFYKIDFTNGNEQLSLLAKKYDKNNNSVFESDELELINNDILKYAKKDGNPDELNSDESNSFLKSLLPEGYYEEFKLSSDMTSDKYVEFILEQLIAAGEENVQDIFSKIKQQGKKVYLNDYDVKQLLKLTSGELKTAINLAYIESRGEQQFNGTDLVELAKLSDEELEQAKQFYNIKERDIQFNGKDITKLVKLSNEESERAKQLFFLEGRNRQLKGVEIAKLAKLSGKKFERAKQLSFIDGREQQFGGHEIIKLLNFSEQEFEWTRLYLFKKNISIYDIENIVKHRNEEIEDFLSQNIDITTVEATDEYIRIYCGDRFYTFDDSGLIDEGNLFGKIYDDNIKNGSVTTIFNKRINVKQEITRGIICGTDERKIILSEIDTYYDNDNNVIREINIKRDNETGALNVSETDKNGKQIPIQWESINPENGAMVTERHLTSPAGTKTDFFCEENKNFKTTEYQITGSDGKVLIYVHQTFKKTSDNTFISSINTDPKNKKNTQIYKIEYTDNDHVKIYDKKNNKTTDIDLNKIFTNSESRDKLLLTVQQLPGHILLEFAEKPFMLNYNQRKIQDAYWDDQFSKLEICNYENTVGQNDNLLAVLTHELGHYLDLHEGKMPQFSNNKKFLESYERELKAFQDETTIEQKEYIDYFTSDSKEYFNSDYERVAETHSIFNTTKFPALEMRRLYFAKYFPETMAEIMKLLLEEEGVKTE